MRKALVMLLLLSLMASLAVVLGGAQQEKVVFAFDSRTNREKAYRQCLAEFGDTVVYNPLPGTSDDQLNYYTTRFAAKSATPDIVNMDIVWPTTFASAGWLLNLNPYFEESTKAQFLKGYINALNIEGKLVGVPGTADALLLYYRKDLLKKYGFDHPPKTWYEVIAQAKVILEGEDNPHLTGITYQGANIEGMLANYLEFLWGTGGSILDEKGNVIIDNEKGIKALRMMIDLYRKYGVATKGVVTTETDDSRVIFQDGRAIFMLNWTYAWGKLQSKDSKVKGKVGISTPPAFPGYDPHVALGGWQYAINAYSKHPDLAWAVAKKLGSPECQKIQSLLRGDLPTNKMVYKDKEVLAANPWYKGMLPILATGKSRPKSPAYGQVSQTIRNALSAALAGAKSPEQALSDLSKELKELPLYQ